MSTWIKVTTPGAERVLDVPTGRGADYYQYAADAIVRWEHGRYGVPADSDRDWQDRVSYARALYAVGVVTTTNGTYTLGGR